MLNTQNEMERVPHLYCTSTAQFNHALVVFADQIEYMEDDVFILKNGTNVWREPQQTAKEILAEVESKTV